MDPLKQETLYFENIHAKCVLHFGSLVISFIFLKKTHLQLEQRFHKIITKLSECNIQ